ncbi:MAG TPA: hypothetical protein DCO89_02820 [Clostridiales bacterium]|nr:hypothetical protein [Clostridiales bacterium]
MTDAIKVAQQALIKNTADLSDDLRAKVYSKFQSVKYRFLNIKEFRVLSGTDGSFGFFSPNDNTIYFLNDESENNVAKVGILHEMLHAVTTCDYDNVNIANNKSGFKCIETDTQGKVGVISAYGRGINEGATQFFAEQFLNSTGTDIYPFEIHILKILCEECGYQEIKNAYFTGSIEELKKVIRNGYKLKDDYLIDNLIIYMDIFGVIYGKETEYFKSFLLIKNCYATLLQMKLNKMMVATNYIAPQKELAKNFNVLKYLTQNLNPLFAEFFVAFLEDVELNKTAFLSSGTIKHMDIKSARQASARFANAVANINVEYLEENYVYFKQHALDILKQLCTENIYGKKDEKTGQAMRISNTKLIYLFLGFLHNQNDKIDLSSYSESEKYEFISLALFNRYQNSQKEIKSGNIKKMYEHFYPKDLVNFVNSGYYECDTFFDEKAMEYIMPEIKQVHPRLFQVKEFALAYKAVKQKQNELEKKF